MPIRNAPSFSALSFSALSFSVLALAAASPALAEPPADGPLPLSGRLGVGQGNTAFGPWSAPVSAESLPGSSPAVNSAAGDGCPILDPFTNALYIASSRPGGQGGLDIWRADYNGQGWDAPVNLPPPVNSAANDFCPTPVFGQLLFFVSTREEPNGDIYVAKGKDGEWGEPTRLPAPINSEGAEFSPSFVFQGFGGSRLFFSSDRDGDQDIYVAKDYKPATNETGAVEAVDALNTPFSEARPNVRRDGLEIVFDTDRYQGVTPDIWSSQRDSVDAPWGPPRPIDAVNSRAGESRASLSGNGRVLLFGTARPGGEGASDVYVSTRERLKGKDRP